MKSKTHSSYSLLEMIGYLYWKIFDSYKWKGYPRWKAGKIAKRVCIRVFGFENYQAWRYRFRDNYEMEGFEE